ncbi:hypothetical protein ACIA8G_10820 [Lentzea sp. NPDC051213]|uniref:hypothetical protein n=1 Tax=Lentzea sp. NPDC051213 TaxID=3364126 RepID=UPI003797C519
MERSAVPAVLEDLPSDRLSPVAERTCYFVVAEALTNAAKHAEACEVRGLDDRVAAAGGRLTVRSSAGQGTTVRAEFRDLPR